MAGVGDCRGDPRHRADVLLSDQVGRVDCGDPGGSRDAGVLLRRPFRHCPRRDGNCSAPNRRGVAPIGVEHLDAAHRVRADVARCRGRHHTEFSSEFREPADRFRDGGDRAVCGHGMGGRCPRVRHCPGLRRVPNGAAGLGSICRCRKPLADGELAGTRIRRPARDHAGGGAGRVPADATDISALAGRSGHSSVWSGDVDAADRQHSGIGAAPGRSLLVSRRYYSLRCM